MFYCPVEYTFVGSLVLLFDVLDAEDGLVLGTVRPRLEPTSLHREVFEALEPFYFRYRVTLNLKLQKGMSSIWLLN